MMPIKKTYGLFLKSKHAYSLDMEIPEFKKEMPTFTLG